MIGNIQRTIQGDIYTKRYKKKHRYRMLERIIFQALLLWKISRLSHKMLN